MSARANPSQATVSAGSLAPALTVAGCATIWGLYWLPVRALEDMGITGVWSVAAFNLPGLALTALVFMARPQDRQGTMKAALLAGALAGIGLGFYAMGLILTTVVRATLLFYLTPVWGTLFAMILLSERPGLSRWIALAMGVAGLALTLGLTPDDLSLNFGMGEVFGLISGVAWALAAVVIRGGAAPPIAPMVFFQYVSTVTIAVAAALMLGVAPPAVELLGEAMISWPVLPSFAMLLSLYAIFWAISKMSPGRSGLLMMTEVVVAVLSAALLLPEEALGLWEWAGAALIVGAGIVEVGSGDA